jgi:hypothetical protein
MMTFSKPTGVYTTIDNYKSQGLEPGLLRNIGEEETENHAK